MKYFITGSSGFIGSNLVAQLRERGHVVAGYDKKPSRPEAMPDEFAQGDLLDKSLLHTFFHRFAPDIVIHLAAKTSLKEVPPGSDHYAANTTGTANLLDVIEAAPTVRRCIFTSTKYVCRGRDPEDERDYDPHTSYGRSKADMEEIIRERNGGGREWSIVRPTTVWGPGMGKHYQKFLSLISKGRYFHIGHGTAEKHLCYVGNIVHEYLCIAEAPTAEIQGKVFYLADYQPSTLHAWAEALRKSLGAPPIANMPKPLAATLAMVGDLLVAVGLRKFPFTSFRYKNLTEDDVCLIEPTQKVCGPLPFSLEQGAEHTARWFKALPKPANSQ